ncbi:hypothetical protein MPH_05724 [Macrophomina phaseolina MS6]|uniref:N-acetyltransferase domain-containing protein n=1 Tax=Macrophomina phaseolina (strain MS6) TaxID=1126212 RepID=K2SJS0_MACPH|nr:hypothetical protein MPH_05724 [Macrophomina phaseolina MS6]
MIDNFTFEAFGPYWFSNFGAVMLLGDVKNADDVRRMEEEGCNWEKQCLGSFYVKPNYPGRSSHVCNGGFLVTDGARNRGVGRLMGECYLEWAPLLGYKYSVFNLVYETNVASCRIWDALGFKRIGRVPGCGNLATQPEGHFVDAIIYGRHLGYKKEDADDEKRFERIKYYLKTGKYPGDADSAEKNRLRAAVRNYTLVEGGGGGDGAGGGNSDKLMLGDKEVISEPRMQYQIARQYHRQNKDTHAGINKTTATVSEKYHWNRIKTTVTEVIENCAECNEKLKKKSLKSAAAAAAAAGSNNNNGNNGGGQRNISGSDIPAFASPSPSQPDEPMATSSATPTSAPEFLFQHEFSVDDSTSASANTPRASSSAPEMQYDMAGDNMTLDPHNIATLSSAVQNLGSSGDETSAYDTRQHGFDAYHSTVDDPFSQNTHSQQQYAVPTSTTSIDPASLQQPASATTHAQSQHLDSHVHRQQQQYLSPYPFGAQHTSSPDPAYSDAALHQTLSPSTGFVHDGALIDSYAPDTHQQHFGPS